MWIRCIELQIWIFVTAQILCSASFFFGRVQHRLLTLNFIAWSSNMWKCLTAWQCKSVCVCVFRKWPFVIAWLCVLCCMSPDGPVVGLFLEEKRKNTNTHTHTLEELSQRGCIWHIASKRPTLTWQGNWFNFIFGKVGRAHLWVRPVYLYECNILGCQDSYSECTDEVYALNCWQILIAFKLIINHICIGFCPCMHEVQVQTSSIQSDWLHSLFEAAGERQSEFKAFHLNMLLTQMWMQPNKSKCSSKSVSRGLIFQCKSFPSIWQHSVPHQPSASFSINSSSFSIKAQEAD